MRVEACLALGLVSLPSVQADWWQPWTWGGSGSSPAPNPPWGGGGGGGGGDGGGSGGQSTSYVTKTNLLCQTLQGFGAPGIVPTQTVTQLSTAPFAVYVTSTSTPIIKITPSPVQVISSVISQVTATVQAPPITSIFSTTSTLLSSVLATITPPLATSTSTVVRTSTTYTGTTTIPVSGNFLGVLQTGLPSLSKAKRRELLEFQQEREELEERGWFSPFGGGNTGGNPWGNTGGNTGNNGGGLGQFLHGIPGLPSLGSLRSIKYSPLVDIKVLCIAQVVAQKVITTIVLAPAKTVTLDAQTVTSTKTSTTTSTSTLAPSSITITSSFSTTQIISSTRTLPQSTFTSTTTSSALVALPTTVYAACSAQNLLGPQLPSIFGSVAGDLITDVYYDPSQVLLMTTPGARAYDCCTQCIDQASSGCAFGAWDTSGICYLHFTSDETCPAQSAIMGQYVVEAQPQGTLYAVYNGYCGSLAYGGIDTGS